MNTLTLRLATLLTGFALITASRAEAKSCARCRLASGWGFASQPDTLFDSGALVSVEGEVISVQDVAAEKEIVAGAYVLINVKDQQWPIRLCPTTYLKEQGLKLEPYDNIKVSGSKVPFGDKTGIIATELHQGTKKLRFRDDQGKPVWE